MACVTLRRGTTEHFERINQRAVQVWDADSRKMEYSGIARYLVGKTPIRLVRRNKTLEDGTVNSHYMAITNILQFCRLNHAKKGNTKYDLCPYCNEPFRAEDDAKKQQHLQDCVVHMFKEKRLKLTESDKYRIKFSRIDALLRRGRL
jgi:hypothetical protein